MSYSAVNDLAKAMKALDGKKTSAPVLSDKLISQWPAVPMFRTDNVSLHVVVFLQWNRDGCWTMYRSHTSSLLWPPTNGGYLYALISQFTVSMQHATERVERPGESQEALDGKKEYHLWKTCFWMFLDAL